MYTGSWLNDGILLYSTYSLLAWSGTSLTVLRYFEDQKIYMNFIRQMSLSLFAFPGIKERTIAFSKTKQPTQISNQIIRSTNKCSEDALGSFFFKQHRGISGPWLLGKRNIKNDNLHKLYQHIFQHIGSFWGICCWPLGFSCFRLFGWNTASSHPNLLTSIRQSIVQSDISLDGTSL